jgi:hypothetical protein
MKYQKALEGGAVVGDAANFVNDTVNEFLANCVVSTGICKDQSLSFSSPGLTE